MTSLLGESDIYIRFALSLSVVLGLIVASAWALRFMRMRQTPWGSKAGPKRLEILETLILDDKRRMMLIRQDSQEHLVLLGSQSETIVGKGDHMEAEVKPLKVKRKKG